MMLDNFKLRCLLTNKKLHNKSKEQVVRVLKDTKADVLVCYLTVGSKEVAKFYAQFAIDAKSLPTVD